MDQALRIDAQSNSGRNSSRLDMLRTLVQDFYVKTASGVLPRPNPISEIIDQAAQSGVVAIDPATNALSFQQANDPAAKAARNALGVALVGALGVLPREPAPKELDAFRMTNKSHYRLMLAQLPCAYNPLSKDLFFLSAADRAETLSRLGRLIAATTITNPNQVFAQKELQGLGAQLIGANYVLPRSDLMERASALLETAAALHPKRAQSFRAFALERDAQGVFVNAPFVQKYLPAQTRENTLREDLDAFLSNATPAQVNGIKSALPEDVRKTLIDTRFVQALRGATPTQLQALAPAVPHVDGKPPSATELEAFVAGADGIQIDGLRKYVPELGNAQRDPAFMEWLQTADDRALEPLRARSREVTVERELRYGPQLDRTERYTQGVTVQEGAIPRGRSALPYEESLNAFLARATRSEVESVQARASSAREAAKRDGVPRTAERFWSLDERVEALNNRRNKPFTADDRLHITDVRELKDDMTLYDLEQGVLEDEIARRLDLAAQRDGSRGVDLERDRLDLLRDVHESSREFGLSPGRELQFQPGDLFAGTLVKPGRHHALVRGTIENAASGRTSDGYAFVPLHTVSANNLRNGEIEAGTPRKGDLYLVAEEGIPVSMTIGTDQRVGMRVDPALLQTRRDASMERKRAQDRADFSQYSDLQSYREARKAELFAADDLLAESLALAKAAEVFKVSEPRLLHSSDLKTESEHSGPILSVGRSTVRQLIGKRNIVAYPMSAFAREPRVDRDATIGLGADGTVRSYKDRELSNARVNEKLQDFAARIKPALNTEQRLFENKYVENAAISALLAQGVEMTQIRVLDLSDQATLEALRAQQPFEQVLTDRLFEPDAQRGKHQLVDPGAKHAYQDAQREQGVDVPLPANARQRAVALIGATIEGITQADSANAIAFSALLADGVGIATVPRPSHPDLEHPVRVGDPVRFHVTRNGLSFDPPERLLRSSAYDRFSAAQEISREQAFIEAGYHVLAKDLGVARTDLAPLPIGTNHGIAASLGLLTNHAAYFTAPLADGKIGVATLPSRLPAQQEADSLALVGIEQHNSLDAQESGRRSAIRSVHDDMKVATPGVLFAHGWTDGWHVDPRGSAIAHEPRFIRDARNAGGAMLTMNTDGSVTVDGARFARDHEPPQRRIETLVQGFAYPQRDARTGVLCNGKFESRALVGNDDLAYLAYPHSMGDIIEIHRDTDELRMHPNINFKLDQPLQVEIKDGVMRIEPIRHRNAPSLEKSKSVHDLRTAEQNLRLDDREHAGRDSLNIDELMSANNYGISTRPLDDLRAEQTAAQATRESNAAAARTDANEIESDEVTFEGLDVDSFDSMPDFGEPEIDLASDFDNRDLPERGNDGGRSR